jgi:DNA-binding response OmpR family regulator
MSQDIRVLVGDDDVNDRFFLEWGFKETAPSVRLDFARTGEEIIRQLEDTSRPAPSLLIIDSMMPGMDGFTVLQRLRAKKELWRLPIIMLSGLPYDKNEDRARALGVSEYVGKPHDLDDLKALVQGWKQKYLDPIRLRPPNPNEQGQLQLLVADTSSTFRKFVQKVTAEVCPEAALTLFQDSVEVLRHFEQNRQPAPALLLLDLGTASVEVLKWLRRDRLLLHLPIIIWSSTPVRIEEELAREFGVTEYVKKPNTFAGLLQSIFDFAQRYGAPKDKPN